MGYYSDPTANMAIGNIKREFSKHIKKAKKLRELYKNGKISDDDLEKAHEQFKGLYKYVLDDVLSEESE